MPELPEVETVRKGLIPALEGRRIDAVTLNRPNLRFPFPERFAERLTGSRVERIDRRAKYLLLRLDSGETLIGHLGMSGRFSIEAAGDGAAQPGGFVHAAPADPRHDHVVIEAEGGVTVRYNDPRRFGYMDLFATEAEATHKVLGALGPEPHGNQFSGPYLAAALAGRRTPIKTALLDQSIVAGLGNIYVCEALHRSGISPRRQAASIAGIRAERLAVAVRAVIVEAIDAGGSSLKDFAATDGALGYFQHRFRVYDRLDAPCPTTGCAGAVQRIVQAGRSTWFCSTCQR
ncbi:bifunctional DNA-formamidopyrimidine glycosylase/DNA-(apurinic or apyrimidinic site) lyase [Maricaulis maris]|uniref:Formamidopyrimidine-DNA glycosylase n=1 Tax=Maricaulis maris TaxID=74318 RepID=A0A495CW06_9PROT|nr:bifunctional DNA-formamidopyrimidine glycosylase/DNA-(apurinic or apyrimidinic site) lyase [Maricaulis maris]RKQ89555.1 DNA-(apurinic or apyrimidinic site) lyase [Maricaulis maris]